MELPVVLGCAVPIIFPLAAAGVGLNACVFHLMVMRLGVQVTNRARASYNYLWISVCLGMAIPLWLFFENSFHGRWMLLIGMPGGCFLGAVLASGVSEPLLQRAQAARKLRMQMPSPVPAQLAEPLLLDLPAEGIAAPQLAEPLLLDLRMEATSTPQLAEPLLLDDIVPTEGTAAIEML